LTYVLAMFNKFRDAASTRLGFRVNLMMIGAGGWQADLPQTTQDRGETQ